VLNPTAALVRCKAVRERHDGSVIAALGACHIVARGKSWQVAALISRR
jgi:hypothetical protein